jgi:iron only hydrogenase large subunit-like protein
MESNVFHHALNFCKDTCVGCSHCMRVCSTQAIRVWNGKAELMPNRCIDCGECYRVCPVDAIKVEQDDFDLIYNFKYKVATVPGVLMGQLTEEINPRQIYSVLMELGFTHVCEVEAGAEILRQAMADYVRDNPDKRPLISAFCPAIVRLIQVKFPALVNHIIPMKPPLDVAGLYYKQLLVQQGAKEDEIGLFYITPCAAKIAAIKSPVGEEKSVIDGVINMDFAYNKVLTTIKQSKSPTCIVPADPYLSPEAILWSLTTGESSNMPGRSLAIDGINNVIEFLEELENEEVSNIDFLELRSCDESCAGGILTSTNRFFTAERLRNRAETVKQQKKTHNITNQENISSFRDDLSANLAIDKIKPRSMLKLDENISGALEKMKKVNELMEILPYVDCGICGSPTCQSLAEDIVREEAEVSRCIFIQRILEQKGTFTQQESIDIMKAIWGEKKLDKDIK